MDLSPGTRMEPDNLPAGFAMKVIDECDDKIRTCYFLMEGLREENLSRAFLASENISSKILLS